MDIILLSILIVFLLVFLWLLADLRAGQQQLSAGQQLLATQVAATWYCLPPKEMLRIKASVYVLFRDGVPAGVAFFLSPRKALTCYRCCTNEGDGGRRTQRRAWPQLAIQASTDNTGPRIAVRVVHHHAKLDFAVLEPVSEFVAPAHLRVAPMDAHEEDRFVLLTVNIGSAEECPEDFFRGFTKRPATVAKLSNRHMLVDARSFDGDSGGAILLARTGEAVGMHLSTVNRIRDHIDTQLEMGRRLGAVENSVRDLINRTGCVWLRLDIKELESALRY